jgi:hypothetical protein
VYRLETTRQLLERVRTDRHCVRYAAGRRSNRSRYESTFSRAFQEFAESELPQRLYEDLVLHTQRPRKSERALSGRRLPRQRRQSLEEMLEELSRHCDIGVKTSSKGHQQYWRGYKLHLDVATVISRSPAFSTAASLHDSQAAIPLATMTAQRVISLYDLMDCSYDTNEIYAHSESLRTMVERVYSRLKDEFGARLLRVRGASKIMAHLMFGVLALTFDQLLKLAG